VKKSEKLYEIQPPRDKVKYKYSQQRRLGETQAQPARRDEVKYSTGTANQKR
jgi:hypothetical protein